MAWRACWMKIKSSLALGFARKISSERGAGVACLSLWESRAAAGEGRTFIKICGLVLTASLIRRFAPPSPGGRREMNSEPKALKILKLMLR